MGASPVAQLIAAPLLVVLMAAAAAALMCEQCGQYNDGVGSITPCINETHSKLVECRLPGDVACIKYISEGTMVRDCATKCVEKVDWKARTYCCSEDGCNAAPATFQGLAELLLPTTCAMLLLILLPHVRH